MRISGLWALVVLAAAALPSQLLADQFCGDPLPSYQNCGSPTASPLVLAVNAYGAIQGVNAIWYDYQDQKKADFTDQISIGSTGFRNLRVQFPYSNQTCYETPAACPTDPSQPYKFLLPLSGSSFQGLQIYFRINVNDPFHGPYSWDSDVVGSDGVPHVYGEIITSAMFPDLCPQVAGSCVFLGFKDLPKDFYVGDLTEPDYNDFEMVVWGVDCVSGCGTAKFSGEVVTPEPASIVLFAGSGLSLLFAKMRRSS